MVVILVVIVIIGIGFGILPGTFVERSLYNAAIQIQQTLLYAQNKAVTYSTTKDSGKFEVYFFPADNTIYVEKDLNASFDPVTKTMSGAVEKIVLGDGIKIQKIYLATFDNLSNILSPPLAYVKLNFDNFGNPNYYCKETNDNTYGIFISTTNKNKVIRITISKLGNISIEWVKR
ncbi:hypothetical protein [Caldisericum exile]|uniref:General secretion pathway GspH domain-containing protein n=1 Tax=Caldisericum exile (strain DSM 21853 / NBRC 104410 / AZM16c01) TaxID=511051 RepID=A0A7U6JGG1_CALEA|nr:hypothetical protein [Caldisericum exile]BAL81455.1 hypothetical protein CSE_13290 [Caldisericum exile AZM16c01]